MNSNNPDDLITFARNLIEKWEKRVINDIDRLAVLEKKIELCEIEQEMIKSQLMTVKITLERLHGTSINKEHVDE